MLNQSERTDRLWRSTSENSSADCRYRGTQPKAQLLPHSHVLQWERATPRHLWCKAIVSLIYLLKTACQAGWAHKQPVEEHFQKIAAQMADIEATKPRAQLLHHSDLPQRERGAPRVAEQFWRQAATRKDKAPMRRRPHTLPRSKRKSLPSALKSRCAISDVKWYSTSQYAMWQNMLNYM